MLVICPNCHAKNPFDARYCRMCKVDLLESFHEEWRKECCVEELGGTLSMLRRKPHCAFDMEEFYERMDFFKRKHYKDEKEKGMDIMRVLYAVYCDAFRKFCEEKGYRGYVNSIYDGTLIDSML